VESERPATGSVVQRLRAGIEWWVLRRAVAKRATPNCLSSIVPGNPLHVARHVLRRLEVALDRTTLANLLQDCLASCHSTGLWLATRSHAILCCPSPLQEACCRRAMVLLARWLGVRQWSRALAGSLLREISDGQQ